MNRRYIDFVPVNRHSDRMPEDEPRQIIIEETVVETYVEPEEYESEEDIFSEPVADSNPILDELISGDSSEFEGITAKDLASDPALEDLTVEDVLAPEEEPVAVSVKNPEPVEVEDVVAISDEEPLSDLSDSFESVDFSEPEEEFIKDAQTFAGHKNFDFGIIEDYVPLEKQGKAAAKTATTAAGATAAAGAAAVATAKKPAAFRFTSVKVEKRPLSTPRKPEAKKPEMTPEAALKAAKSENLIKKPIDFAPKQPEKKPDDSFKTPKKSPFINTNAVEKRPLSKTDYRAQVPEVKEEATGPVAIIDKSKKESNLGLIIAIILTIIFGAAVGTLAFFLLPS